MTYNVFGGTLNLAQVNSVAPFSRCYHCYSVVTAFDLSKSVSIDNTVEITSHVLSNSCINIVKTHRIKQQKWP